MLVLEWVFLLLIINETVLQNNPIHQAIITTTLITLHIQKVLAQKD